MIFTSKLPIHLKRDSELAKVRPTKVFARFFHDLTGGMLSEKEERQTFTAVEILQDFHKVFRKMQINNLKSLSVDDVEYYKDVGETIDDMENAFAKMKLDRADIQVPVFQHMYLSVQTHYSGLTLFLEVDINRCHLPSEPPVILSITGVIQELKQKEGETPEQLSERVKAFFPNSDRFSDSKQQFERVFNSFSALLMMELKQSLGIEEAEPETDIVVIRPSVIGKRTLSGRGRYAYEHHYNNAGTDFFYMWFMMSILYDNNYSSAGLTVHSDECVVLAQYDDEVAVCAADQSVFDLSIPERDIEIPAQYMPPGIDNESTSDSSWFSFEGYSDSTTTSSGGDSGSSSCGSSCGGGCGS